MESSLHSNPQLHRYFGRYRCTSQPRHGIFWNTKFSRYSIALEHGFWCCKCQFASCNRIIPNHGCECPGLHPACQPATDQSVSSLSDVQQPIHMHAPGGRMVPLRSQPQSPSCYVASWKAALNVLPDPSIHLRHPTPLLLRFDALASFAKHLPRSYNRLHIGWRRRYQKQHSHVWVFEYCHHLRPHRRRYHAAHQPRDRVSAVQAGYTTCLEL